MIEKLPDDVSDAIYGFRVGAFECGEFVGRGEGRKRIRLMELKAMHRGVELLKLLVPLFDADSFVEQTQEAWHAALDEAAKQVVEPVGEKELHHPMQPIYLDEHGTARFKQNAIVRHLLDAGIIDLNKIAAMDFDAGDREQFAQLIGYSVSGFGDLHYSSVETVAAADAIVRNLTKTPEVENSPAIAARQWAELEEFPLGHGHKIGDKVLCGDEPRELQQIWEIASGPTRGPVTGAPCVDLVRPGNAGPIRFCQIHHLRKVPADFTTTYEKLEAAGDTTTRLQPLEVVLYHDDEGGTREGAPR